MQPYFMPYGGYFRLFAAADQFVIYDCVQFPRRGWVQRNRLPDANGALQWLTLPLQAAPREARIDELAFRPDAATDFARQLRRFPALMAEAFRASAIGRVLNDFSGTPVDYLERTLSLACDRLGLRGPALRSSRLGLPPSLHGEQRILAIVEALGGTDYVNAPGGRALYDATAFARRGIALRFLDPWQGPADSVLLALARGDEEAVAAQIKDQAGAHPATTQDAPTCKAS